MARKPKDEITPITQPEEAPRTRKRVKLFDDAPDTSPAAEVVKPEPKAKSAPKAKPAAAKPEPAKPVVEKPARRKPAAEVETPAAPVVQTPAPKKTALFGRSNAKPETPAKVEPKAAEHKPVEPKAQVKPEPKTEAKTDVQPTFRPRKTAAVESTPEPTKPERAKPEPKARAPRPEKPAPQLKGVSANPAAGRDTSTPGLTLQWRAAPKLSELVDETELVDDEPEVEVKAEVKPEEKPAAKPARRGAKPKPFVPKRDYGQELAHIQPVFRPKSAPAPKTSEMDEEESTFEPPTESSTQEVSRAPREKRGRRDRDERRERPPVETRAPEPVVEAPKPKAPQMPEAPPRERVAAPLDAPQVILHNGVPVLVRNQKAVAPMFFHASALDERSLSTVMDEVKTAAEHGIHTFSVLVDLDVDEDAVNDSVGFAGYMAKSIASADPEAQVVLRVAFASPANWERRFPNAVYRELGGATAEPSFCDDEYWTEAENSLRRLITLLRKVDTEGRISGIHLERGEWFLPEDRGYDISKAAEKKFRDWLRSRYRNDVVTLRAAWFDGSVTFDSAAIPPFQRKGVDGEFMRLGRKARRWVDYHLFISDTTAERIADLAYAAKQSSEGRFLVGVSYGYTFEWSHPASGHLSLGKLLRCPDIDYIAGPPSYKNREPGGTGSFPWPIDSFALNTKIAVSEEDFKTPISGRPEPDDFNPVMKTPQALESVHWRGAGSALAHASGICWMDSWGNGWLGSRGIWERGQKVAQALTWRMNATQAAPDVAVLIDERSLAYLVDERAFSALVQNVRESILRSGLSVGFYLLSDLAHRENFPDCKLYVFVNAWDVRPEVRSAIKSRLQRDGKVLFWLYAAGLFEGGRESLERVREATGIALRPQPFNSRSGTTLLNMRDPLCQPLPESRISQGGQLEPSYFAIPEEDAQVLGEYSQSGLPSYLARSFKGEQSDENWTSVFLGEPVVTPGLFRALGQMAGAHIWSHDDDVIHARAPFLTIHCTGAGPRVITLPDKWTAYDLVNGTWAFVEGHGLRFTAMDGATHSFLIGNKSDIEALLSSSPDLSFTEEEMLERRDNTTHWDQMSFDVAIMKLDEWVEESWSEEMADDLLLRPSMIEDIDETTPDESEEVSISSGRRRRKRRDTKRERQPKGDHESPETGISFLFRKRE
jgi:hypothetical protein